MNRTILCALSLATLLLACNEDPQRSRSAGQDSLAVITPYGRYEGAIRGKATIVADADLREWVEAERAGFEAFYKGAFLEVLYLPGEAAAEALLSADSIHLAILGRQLNAEELRFLKSKSLKARIVAQATEAISLVMHTANADSLLSLDDLEGMLTGKTTRWNQVNAASKLGAIQLVADHPQSGVIQYLRDSALKGQAIGATFFAADSLAGVLDYVRKTPGALGFISLTPLSDLDNPRVRSLREGVTLVALERKVDEEACGVPGDYFRPYQSYLATGCYPWTRRLFTVLTESRFGLSTGFVSYIDSDQGQRIVHKMGLAPSHTIPRLVQFPPKQTGTDIVK